MATASTIIDLARNLIRAESTSDIPTVSDDFLLTALSEANLKWARTFKAGGEDPIVFERETGFDLIADTTLSAACTTSDVTLSLTDSSSFASASTILVWDDAMPDFISYTGNAANTLSGVTGIGFAHESGDTVQALYALPSNFGTFRESATYGDGVMLNGLPLRFMAGIPVPGFFSLYDDGTTKFLVLPRSSTGSASVLYNKVSATIDSTDDTVDVPDEFQFFLVWHLVAYAYMGRADEAQLYLFAQTESNKVLQQALRNRNTGRKIRTRPFARQPLDFIPTSTGTIPIYG